jgi:hypothetical protein
MLLIISDRLKGKIFITCKACNSLNSFIKDFISEAAHYAPAGRPAPSLTEGDTENLNRITDPRGITHKFLCLKKEQS